MPFNRDFAEALVEAMSQSEWDTLLPDQILSNPLDLTFKKQSETRRLIIHARQITLQARSGPNPSSHNRPEGEMHTQMIFDGDKRGAGIRNTLRFVAGAETVLFGFYLFPTIGYVVAAYDPEKHREYAYSKSLQVKFSTLEQGIKLGIAIQTRQSDETIVAFPINEITEYLEYAREFHSLASDIVSEANIAEDVESRETIKRVLIDVDKLPELPATDRKRDIIQVGRYIRNYLFSKSIRSIYERCAICGFQYDYILDAAHIVPVADGGTDTYDNGLGLCPNCHRMFDSGLILVDGDRQIYINPRHAEEYEQIGRADSLENLRTTLRKVLWMPSDENYHPSAENLQKTFLARR